MAGMLLLNKKTQDTAGGEDKHHKDHHEVTIDLPDDKAQDLSRT